MKGYFYESEFVKDKLSEDKRMSGRGLLEYRDLHIETGFLKNADGSAMVTLGKTKVVAGVKILPGVPYPDSPDEGSISVNIELSPMSDPNLGTGPPDEDSIEVARVVDRCIRESKAIDFKTLCIKEGEFVWTIFVDLYLVNNDGNVLDASSIAVLTSLKDAKFPKLDKEFKIVKDVVGDENINLKNNPLLFTFYKIGDKMILDADIVEIGATDARLSIGVTEEKKLVAMQKGLDGSLTFDEVKFSVKTSIAKHKELFAKINSVIKKDISKREKR